ncbi:docking protein 2 isoform 2-T2 [Polymixia lowei]
MEEDIRKQGMVYLQQQRFGKKWKRVWCVLYKESSCSISRLEFFERKEGGAGTLERSDKALRKQQEHKKVIRLSDCIRVSEVEMEGCPRDTSAFLLETTDKLYVFAADRQHLDDWTHKLCETAFPMSWGERSGRRSSVQRGSKVQEEEEEGGGMEDNSLYSGRETVRDFRVGVRRTDASERCGLRGVCVLRTDCDSLLALELQTGEVLFSWPYRFLRRFGRDKFTFSFEAGRRCDSGEGNFEFDTRQGNVLFQALEGAIQLQRGAGPQRQKSGGGQDSPESPLSQPRTQPPAQSHLEPPVDKMLTGVKSLTLETRGVPVPRKNQVRTILSCPLPHGSPESSPNPHLDQTYSQISMHGTLPGSGTKARGEIKRERGEKRGDKRGDKRGERESSSPCPCPPPVSQEPEYSLPFDSIAKKVMTDILNSSLALSGADPLYDSIDESQIRSAFQGMTDAPRLTYTKAEHIYDEPEGCAVIGQNATPPTSMYDNPEEVKGNAWRIMGTVVDPKGHEYPYDPRVDDYAVPKHPQRAFPAEQVDKEEEEEEEEDQDDDGSPYDNVMVKMTEKR